MVILSLKNALIMMYSRFKLFNLIKYCLEIEYLKNALKININTNLINYALSVISILIFRYVKSIKKDKKIDIIYLLDVYYSLTI